MAEETTPGSPRLTSSLRAERLAQLRRAHREDIGRIANEILRAETIPRLYYHFRQHGQEFGATTPEAYLAAFQKHRGRRDMRMFTYLRGRGRVPFWELVAPDTGTSVTYNEQRRVVWSFFRSERPELRFARYQVLWIEVIRAGTGWRFEEDWRWQP